MTRRTPLSISSPPRDRRVYQNWLKSNRDLFQNSIICADMRTTGGWLDIGPLSGWTTLYLFTMDPRAKQIMLDVDERAGACSMHLRHAADGMPISFADRPKLHLARAFRTDWGFSIKAHEPFRAESGPARAEGVKSVFRLDTAHMPGFAGVSYMVTGDRYYLGELIFWTNWAAMHHEKGVFFSHGQLRAAAWVLRNGVQGALIVPDDNPFKAPMLAKMGETFKYLHEMLFGPNALPLGIVELHDGYNYAPWQHDYLIMSVDWASCAGFPDAQADIDTVLNRLLDFSMGRFTNAPDFDPNYGAGYWWNVKDDRKSDHAYSSWKELFDQNKALNKYFTDKWNDYAGSYIDEAMAVALIAIRHGYSKGQQVYDFIVPKSLVVVRTRPGTQFDIGAERPQ